MSEQTWIPTYEAVDIVHKKGYGNFTVATMRNWSRRYKIGKKIGGRFFIDRRALMKLMGEIRDEEKALKPIRTNPAKEPTTTERKQKKA
ncbi:MAG: hypothetical protein PHC68_00500 [Syntrophorhabdaceae bacterium]|nr:hypothetical protein [Syntrophorhabdaceae bacterium]